MASDDRAARIAAHRPLRFTLERNRGEDDVADGVQWADGTVVIRWRGEHPSTQTYSDWGHAMRIHHIGEPNSGDRWTTARWLDGVCFCCGIDLYTRGVICGGNGSQCLNCSATWDGPPNRVQNASEGTWRTVT